MAKEDPALPQNPISDVIDMPYSGNKLHPTQKPVTALKPLIEALTQPEDIVLDPFCGSGSTLIAAKILKGAPLVRLRTTQFLKQVKKRLV